MLILPPYQRKGHGRKLLTTIYNDLRKDSRVQDITGIHKDFEN
jgi:ribosomal protein S18 acetylase RimI-like enzyme